MTFPPHLTVNPFSPHAPQQPANEAPDVPIEVFKAAQQAGAGWLSADGKRVYCQRLGATLEAEWDGDRWGSWWTCEGLPADAVRME